MPSIVSVVKNPLISFIAIPDAFADTTVAVALDVAPVIDSPATNVPAEDESTNVPFANNGSLIIPISLKSLLAAN